VTLGSAAQTKEVPMKANATSAIANRPALLFTILSSHHTPFYSARKISPDSAITTVSFLLDVCGSASSPFLEFTNTPIPSRMVLGNGNLSKPCAIHEQEEDKERKILSISLEDHSGWSLSPVSGNWQDLKIITENLDGALFQGSRCLSR